MPLTKQQKQELVSQLVEKIKAASAVVFADFKGLSVEDMSAMRKNMREQDVEFKVIKKTLIRIAAKEAGYDDIPDELLDGSIGLALGMGDEIAAAKTVYDFSKENENIQLRGSLFEGKVVSLAETKALAMLPSKDELIAKLVYLLKSPIQGFHGVLNNTVSGFVRTLDAIREQKEQSA